MLITVKQSSHCLNFSAATMYALVADGSIKAHRFGLKRDNIRNSEDAPHEYKDEAWGEAPRQNTQEEPMQESRKPTLSEGGESKCEAAT